MCSADCRQSGRSCSADTELSASATSRLSRPRDNHISESATQFRVTVGIGPLLMGSTGDGLGSGDAAAVTGWGPEAGLGWLMQWEVRDVVDVTGWGPEAGLGWLMQWEVMRSSHADRLSAQRRSWPSRVTFMSIRSATSSQSQPCVSASTELLTSRDLRACAVCTLLCFQSARCSCNSARQKTNANTISNICSK